MEEEENRLTVYWREVVKWKRQMRGIRVVHEGLDFVRLWFVAHREYIGI